MVVLTNMHFFTVGKGRKPRFDLHLKIHDLNNVPLVSGHSIVKWHLPHSMHAEHRGRTERCPILNHRVDYSFAKVLTSIRMNTDKNNMLTECLIEFEILQEFGTEKISLGFVRLNLAEYVEEGGVNFRDAVSPPPARRRTDSTVTSLTLSPTVGKIASRVSEEQMREAEEGIVRRYLIQDSKINSTLKIGILLIQVEGDRNFIAPPLKTAQVFSGIAGFMAPDHVEPDTGPLPNLVKNRDVAEVQDLYRKTLVAYWSRQPGELSADECIEDIFSGGNGWKTKALSPDRSPSAPNGSPSRSTTTDEDFDDGDSHHSALRPSDVRRTALQHHRRVHSNSSSPFRWPHRRSPSGSSDKSVTTVTAFPGAPRSHPVQLRRSPRSHYTEPSQDETGMRSATGSFGVSTPLGERRSSSSSGSERDRNGRHSHYHGRRRPKEIGEFEARDDLVCWTLNEQSHKQS